MADPVPANVYDLSLPEQRQFAEGLCQDPKAPHPADGILQNGGLSIEATKFYDDDTTLFRFSHQRDEDGTWLTPENHMKSTWWITEDMFQWVMGRVQASSRGITDALREQMFLPREWNDVDCIVQARPLRGIRLGAWFGRPRTVHPEAQTAGTKSRKPVAGHFTYASEAPESWMYQLYIPGLRNEHNVRNWLRFDGLYALRLTPRVNGRPFFPLLRPGGRHRS
jgi:hypothetical protein